MDTSNDTSYYDTSPETLEQLIHLAVDRMNYNFDDDNHIVYLAWKGKFDNKISCSHHAPKGQQTNWGALQANRPTDFLGWYGRVWLSYRYNRHTFGSNMLVNTGISSGTGGGGLYDLPDWVNLAACYREYDQKNRTYGHYPLSWDSRIFEMDFPLIGKKYINDQVVKSTAAALKNNNFFEYKYPVEQAAYVNPRYQ